MIVGYVSDVLAETCIVSWMRGCNVGVTVVTKNDVHKIQARETGQRVIGDRRRQTTLSFPAISDEEDSQIRKNLSSPLGLSRSLSDWISPRVSVVRK